MQAASVVLPLGEMELAGHARQVVETVAANVFEYVDVIQSVHLAVPVILLYFPGAHAVQSFPLGHVVSVRSTPSNIALAIAVVPARLMYSSTTKTPAILPVNSYPAVGCLPK